MLTSHCARLVAAVPAPRQQGSKPRHHRKRVARDGSTCICARWFGGYDDCHRFESWRLRVIDSGALGADYTDAGEATDGLTETSTTCDGSPTRWPVWCHRTLTWRKTKTRMRRGCHWGSRHGRCELHTFACAPARGSPTLSAPLHSHQ